LKNKVLYEEFNSVVIWLNCTFITRSSRDNKTLATVLELLMANRFYKWNLKVMEAALWCHRHCKVIQVLPVRQEKILYWVVSIYKNLQNVSKELILQCLYLYIYI